VPNTRNKTIIDTKTGNITDINSNDKVVLRGEYPFEGSNYADNIELVLNRENDTPITIKSQYGGYKMQLFVGDFTGDNKSEIMLRGAFGGSGGFEIGVIYRYEDGQLIEIFDQNKFYEDNECTSKYKDNYKVSIDCGKNKYLVDISNREKEYLDYIYSEDKKVNTVSTPYVDAPSGIYPIKQVYNDYYQLLIRQRVVGIANADTIAVVQTLIDLLDSKIDTLDKVVLISRYNQRKSRYKKHGKRI